MRYLFTRRLVIWLVFPILAILIFYKIRFADVPAIGHTVTHGTMVTEVMGTGTLESRVKTTVSPRIQERLSEVLVDQGDSVKAGQLLARLDDEETTQQVAIAEATLTTARRTRERVDADLGRSEAVLTQARLNQKRLTDLAVTRAASQSDADKAVEALAVAEAEMKRSQAAVAETEAQIFVAEKNLLLRREQLAFTTIKAPYEGLIIRRDRDPGDIVVPGASLLRLISCDELWISAWVDETAMNSLAPGQPARIIFRSDPGRSYPGTVSRLGREADRETREFLVDVRVSELPPNWAVGQRAEVSIETGRQQNALLLPEDFLQWHQGSAGVWVHSDDKVRWRKVSLGARSSGLIAVTSGLKSGEVVLKAADGSNKPLDGGQRVKLP